MHYYHKYTQLTHHKPPTSCNNDGYGDTRKQIYNLTFSVTHPHMVAPLFFQKPRYSFYKIFKKTRHSASCSLRLELDFGVWITDQSIRFWSWVSRVKRSTRHIIGHFGEESFQPIGVRTLRHRCRNFRRTLRHRAEVSRTFRHRSQR